MAKCGKIQRVHQLQVILKLQIVHKWILMKKPVMSWRPFPQSSCFISWQKSSILLFFLLYFASFCQTGLTSSWMKRPRLPVSIAPSLKMRTLNMQYTNALLFIIIILSGWFARSVHSVVYSAKLRRFDSSLYFSLYSMKRIDPSLRRSIKLGCSFIKIIRIYLVNTEPLRCATGPLHRSSSVWEGFSSVRIDLSLVDDDWKLCYAKVKLKAP